MQEKKNPEVRTGTQSLGERRHCPGGPRAPREAGRGRAVLAAAGLSGPAGAGVAAPVSVRVKAGRPGISSKPQPAGGSGEPARQGRGRRPAVCLGLDMLSSTKSGSAAHAGHGGCAHTDLHGSSSPPLALLRPLDLPQSRRGFGAHPVWPRPVWPRPHPIRPRPRPVWPRPRPT